MMVGAVIEDLMFFSRIEAAVAAAGGRLVRVSEPASLPEDLDVVLVDWSSRGDGWADALRSRTAGRVILFGQHTDLGAHAAARESGLGPMLARSALLGRLPRLFVSDEDGETPPVGRA